MDLTEYDYENLKKGILLILVDSDHTYKKYIKLLNKINDKLDIRLVVPPNLHDFTLTITKYPIIYLNQNYLKSIVSSF
jgi:hypothetical protein